MVCHQQKYPHTDCETRSHEKDKIKITKAIVNQALSKQKQKQIGYMKKVDNSEFTRKTISLLNRRSIKKSPNRLYFEKVKQMAKDFDKNEANTSTRTPN